MSRQVTGVEAFEVEVVLSGSYLPGCPEQGPTYASGGQPAEPESVEDIEVTGFFGLRRVGQTWERVDLLSNVDPKSVAYRQIVANLEAFVGIEAATQAMLADVAEAF